jgi:hypothetical protein
MLTAERLREVLRYDPVTGLFIRRCRAGRKHAGEVAGSATRNGYRSICVDNGRYLAHRLAWLYMNGSWPERQIDHKDRDRSNNRWTNLRLATPSGNTANSRRRSTNTSGFKGVCWDKSRNRWAAYITVGYRHIYLGRFAAVEDAHDAYLAAAQQHFGEFARAA